jgi:hypothetical protein
MATCADLARRLLDAARDDELMASSLRHRHRIRA